MTIRYFSSSIIVSATGADAVTANDGDTIIVDVGVTLGATGATGNAPPNYVYGIYGALGVGDVDVSVLGTVFGTDAGISLDDASARQSVQIGATGRVQGEDSAVVMRGTALTVENAGTMRSDLDALFLVGTSALIVNSGAITSLTATAVFVQSGDAVLVNTGTITSVATLAAYSFIDSGLGAARIWNSGLMVGSISLGDGNDLYQGGGQVMNGRIEGGQGDDTIIGGAADDVLFDINGANWLAGGDGADTIATAISGSINRTNHIFGGFSGGADTSAMDTLSFSNGVHGANIFLSSGGAIGSVTRTSDGAVAAYLTGIENAVGSIAADAIIGSAGANVIEGWDGGDWMVGNGGADRFVFNFAGHADAGDQIRDFRRSEGDKIDLSGIDADVLTPTEDAFVLRTTHTNNFAGEAVVTNFGNSARVDLYINNDNIIDGTFIVVYGEAGVTNLQASDFLL